MEGISPGLWDVALVELFIGHSNLVFVSVSWSCCNKVQTTGWFRMTEIYCLRFLYPRGLRSCHWQDWFLLRVVRETVPCFSPSFWSFTSNRWCPLARGSVDPFFTWCSPCASVSEGLRLIRTQSYCISDLIYKLMVSQMTVFPIKVWLTGSYHFNMWIYGGGKTIQFKQY